MSPQTFRVHVDPDSCQGHNRCYSVAPEPVRRGRPRHVLRGGRRPGARPAWRQGPPGGGQLPGVRHLHRPRWGGRLTSRHPPVVDWATDFDHTDPAWVENPFPIWDELRRSCPVAHSDRYGGTWLPVRHEDVAAVAYDTEHFTSRSVVVSEVRPGPGRPAGARSGWRPADHAPTRRSTPWPGACCSPPSRPSPSPPWSRSPGSCAGTCWPPPPAGPSFDAAVDYAQHIPLRVIIRMLGFPQEDADIFRQFIRQVLEDVDVPPRSAGRFDDGDIDGYMDERIAEHLADPRDDLTSFLLDAELDGKQARSEEHVRGTMVLLMIAGIDTTWSAIGASLWHLAQHPADRRRLAADPELMATAVEEFLRAYAPVTMARLVAKDFEFHGAPAQGGRLAAAAVPGRQPRPGRVPERRARSSSTGPRTATPRSAWASTAAWAPTWPGWNCAWPWRSGWPATRTSSWPTRPPSPGRAGRSAGRARSRSASWAARPREPRTVRAIKTMMPNGPGHQPPATRPQTGPERQSGGQRASISRWISSPNGRSASIGGTRAANQSSSARQPAGGSRPESAAAW